jgi:hypothetical protein
MEDKWYSLRCRVLLAEELRVSPDDLDIESISEMFQNADYQEKDEEGAYRAVLRPETKRQEEAIVNNYYEVIVNRMICEEYPFQGFFDHIRSIRGLK